MQRCLCLYVVGLALLSSVFYTTAAVNRSAEATYQLVYRDITAFHGCFRRFNGTHEIGCNTGLNGNVGVIHYVNNSASLNWLVDKGTHKPYVVLITSDMFRTENIKKLRDSQKLNGMMVIFTDTGDSSSYPPADSGFSPDSQCPNRAASIYEEHSTLSCDRHQFNPLGSGLMFEDIGFPMMLLKSQSEVNDILACYHKHNLPTGEEEQPVLPLCSAELKAFMHGAGSTEICWRRNSMVRNFSPDSYCQKLGGYSSHAFLSSNTSSLKNIVITTRTDSFSLFEVTQPGASTPAPGIATLMAIVEALKPHREAMRDAGYNVLFLALTGESFDYIGSQKLIYDMERDFFPNKSASLERVKLSDLDLIVELSTLIDSLSSKSIWTHVDPLTADKHSNIQTFIDALSNNVMPGLSVKKANSAQPLPPSSSQMFIRAKENGMPAVVISDFDMKFETKYYNSFMDTPVVHQLYTERNKSDIDPSQPTPAANHLANIATLVSRAVYNYTTGLDNTSNIEASNSTTTQLLYCLLVSPQCDLFYTIVSPQNLNTLQATSSPFPFYVSVYMTAAIDNIQYLMRQLLVYYTGDKVDKPEADCNNTAVSPDTFWLSGPIVNGSRLPLCVRSTATYHNASSPAFDIEDYDFTSNLYSTWTESVWPGQDPFHIRIFLKPSSEVELASMVAGITIFILSAIVSVLINRRAAILFPPHDDHVALLNNSNVSAPT